MHYLAFNCSAGRHQKWRSSRFLVWIQNDADGFLSRGTNKQIFYKIYQTPEELDEKPIKKLLKEAIKLDKTFKKE